MASSSLCKAHFVICRDDVRQQLYLQEIIGLFMDYMMLHSHFYARSQYLWQIIQHSSNQDVS